MKIIGKSDIGKVRNSNEDEYAFAEIENGGVFAVVCDGMGGACGGKTASKLAIDELVRLSKTELSGIKDLKRIRSILRNHMRKVNELLIKTAKGNPSLTGMGTTAVTVYVIDDTALFMNVGDSRAYIINDKGIEQITVDHSMVEVMVQQGQLTKEEARAHPNRNIITMALGPDEDILPNTYEKSLNEGDVILLCSDGLSNMLTDETIFKTVSQGFEGVADRLINAANRAGGQDNITVIIMTAKEGAVSWTK